MKRVFETVLHQAIVAPVCALAGGIMFLCLACGTISKVGDRLAGRRPRRRAGFDELQVA